MSSKVEMTLSIPVSEATFKARVRPMNSDPRRSFNGLANYMSAIAGDPYAASMRMVTGAVQAYGLITSTAAATASDTITVANVELTAKANGAVPADGEFDVSATVGTQAANIALAINSVPELVGIVTATASLGVVTVTAVNAGAMGNGLALSESADNVTVTAFAHGADGTVYTFANGYTA